MTVELHDEQDDPLETGPLLALAAAAMRAEGLDDSTEVALTFVNAQKMAILNERHMARSGPTDVLAFPVETLVPGEIPARSGEGPPLLLGDIVVCPQVVRDHAEAARVPFDDEMALMVVHGLLHLLGYDHQLDDGARHMEAREGDLLRLVGRVRR